MAPEIEGKSLLPKTPHTSERGSRGPYSEIYVNVWSPAFMVPEDTTQASQGGKQPTVLPFTTHKPQQ